MGEVRQFHVERTSVEDELRQADRMQHYVGIDKWLRWCARRGIEVEWVKDEAGKVIGCNVQKDGVSLAADWIGDSPYAT